MEKKKRKLRHWEMLKWTVSFIEENKEHWEEEYNRQKHMRKEEEDEYKNSWFCMSKEEKIQILKQEEVTRKEKKKKEEERLSPGKIKEIRLKVAIKGRKNWKS